MIPAAREPEMGGEIAPVTKVAQNTAQGKGIHDDNRARRLGFRGALVPGPTLLAYTTEMLMNLFGKNWMTTGEMSLSLINPVYVGERVTARGRVSSKKAEDEGLRIFLDVWAENDEGVTVVTGTASGLLRPVAD